MTEQLETLLGEIEARAKQKVGFRVTGHCGGWFADGTPSGTTTEDKEFDIFPETVIPHPSQADVPALVQALRLACQTIGEMSDAYCGLNDMTGRNRLADIIKILEGEKREA